jgi:cytochrome P450
MAKPQNTEVSGQKQAACPHAQIAADFHPFDLADPFPFYIRARAEAPVFYSEELGYWVVTRCKDAKAVFKDPATFSSENTQSPYKPRPAAVQAVLDEGGFTVSSGLSGRQPPDHTRLRAFKGRVNFTGGFSSRSTTMLA